jgi:hypothetical protein
VPTLKLSGSPARKSAPKSAPKRKPSAKQAPARKTKPAAKSAPKRKPTPKSAPQTQAAQTNGGGTRGPKLPEGWTKRDFEKVVKDMRRAKEAREAAEERMKESRRAANAMALNLLDEGIQMSVISVELDLSRQWLYTLQEKRANGEIDDEANPVEKPAARKRSAATSKPAAKKRPAAKSAPKSKPAAKRSAPGRKRPASKPSAGKGRVRLAR